MERIDVKCSVASLMYKAENVDFKESAMEPGCIGSPCEMYS